MSKVKEEKCKANEHKAGRELIKIKWIAERPSNEVHCIAERRDTCYHLTPQREFF